MWTRNPVHGTVKVTPRGGGPLQETNQPVARGETCPDCSALVADLESHERWHSRLVADLARAVDKEIARSLRAAR